MENQWKSLIYTWFKLIKNGISIFHSKLLSYQRYFPKNFSNPSTSAMLFTSFRVAVGRQVPIGVANWSWWMLPSRAHRHWLVACFILPIFQKQPVHSESLNVQYLFVSGPLSGEFNIWKVHGVELALLGLLQKLMSFLHVDIADHCSSSSSADLSWITSEASSSNAASSGHVNRQKKWDLLHWFRLFVTKSPTENIGWILPMVFGATMIFPASIWQSESFSKRTIGRFLAIWRRFVSRRPDLSSDIEP